MIGKKTIALFLLFFFGGASLVRSQSTTFDRQDTLRGTIGPDRAWWNVLHYELTIEPDYTTRLLKGRNRIEFNLTGAPQTDRMQIDLQQPMQIDKVLLGQQSLPFQREGNVYWIDLSAHRSLLPKSKKMAATIEIQYSGKPRIAVNPPWDGGWIYKKDRSGNPWMSVACQGLGASVWYPCKDHQSDEPDRGAQLNIIVPDTLQAVANGRLLGKKLAGPGKEQWSWNVTSPINNYNLVPYIGRYAHWTDTLLGEEKQKLDLDYWVLAEDLDKAKPHFLRDVKRMLRAFEYWFGPYPFYNDGFKLVQSPHLGMEHQSAIAYGNQFRNGYLGSDLSRSGWGLKWDYIIIHESGHEWFANNITTRDIADMWIHEGFTMYSEVLFIDYHYGRAAADAYVRGLRPSIDNDRPLIAPYGVNAEGSGDMYNKGANLIHTLREVIDNDSLFREILRGMNRDFALEPTTSAAVEAYWSKRTGLNLQPIFDQYLRTTQIPTLESKMVNGIVQCRWTNCLPPFSMPVRSGPAEPWIWVSTQWTPVGKDWTRDKLSANLYIQ
ncbi:MAG: M1 family metallopeptidase [Bacteroidetes bacterium]|nr:M1 family metallopeptidase [Bacteroidota bacterium]